MVDETSMGDFTTKVEQRIKEHLGLKKQGYFAWLCAVRALPFLSTIRYFKHWKKSKICTRLHSVFYALDFVRATNTAVAATNTAVAANTVVVDINTAIGVLNIAADYTTAAKAVAANAGAAANAVAAAYAAAKAAAYAVYATTATAAAAYAVYAAYAATAARDTLTEEFLLEFQELILSDIEAIRDDRYDTLQSDTSLYGELWQHFHDDLTAIGCGYWARLYADLFANRFQYDAEDLEALARRINVPAEVRKNGAAAVAAYLENAEKQGVVYTQRETRLIVLGSAGAGKTTLVRRLNGVLTYPAPKDSTHGVDTSVTLDCNGVRTHVWDFGGQVIYHASHRCFLSENCVYILVVNARSEENRDSARINYWLDTIRIYSDNRAKVFIVINEADGREQNVEDYDSFKCGEYASLIQDIFSFNIGEDMDSVNAFKKELADYIETVGHQSFGKNDDCAMKGIKALFDQNKKILSTDELEEILSSSGIQKKDDQKRAKDLFNTLGVALRYAFMEGYVLDPYWISHGVYKVIDHLQNTKSMFINYLELDTVFSNEWGVYPEGKRERILDLMAHYKIGFRSKDGARGLTVPCTAAQFKPKDVIVEAGPDNLVTQVEREDLREFPADFFYRYMCANENDIAKYGEKMAIWQTGMVLKAMRANALVELVENRRIEITVWGEDKNEYSKKLEMLITDLLQEYRFTQYKENRKKGTKLITVITLVLEVAKIMVEVFGGGSKPQ